MSFRLTPALQSLPGVSLAALVILYVGCVHGQAFGDDMMEPGMMAYSSYGNQNPELPGAAVGYNMPMEEGEEDGPIGVVPTAYSPVSPPFAVPVGINQTGVFNATDQRMPELRHKTDMKAHKTSILAAMPSSHNEYTGSGAGSMTGPAGPPGAPTDIGPAAYGLRSEHPGNPSHQPQPSNQHSGHSRMTMSFPTTPIPIIQHMPTYKGTITHI